MHRVRNVSMWIQFVICHILCCVHTHFYYEKCNFIKCRLPMDCMAVWANEQEKFVSTHIHSETNDARNGCYLRLIFGGNERTRKKNLKWVKNSNYISKNNCTETMNKQLKSIRMESLTHNNGTRFSTRANAKSKLWAKQRLLAIEKATDRHFRQFKFIIHRKSNFD